MTKKTPTPPALTSSEVAVLADSAHRHKQVQDLALSLRYQGATDPQTLENSAREAIRRIGMGIFELGGYLLLLREACGHGDFMPALERLGIGHSSAKRYMALTKRFANGATSRHLEAAGMSRLVELLPLDDDQVDELLLTGQTGELALDDVATMSVKQLRQAVREERAERQAQEEISAKRAEANDKLRRQLKRIQTAPPDDVLADLKRESAAASHDAQGAILGSLRAALAAITDHAERHDQAGEHDLFMAGLVGQVQQTLTRVREQFNLPDVAATLDEKPEWMDDKYADRPKANGAAGA